MFTVVLHCIVAIVAGVDLVCCLLYIIDYFTYINRYDITENTVVVLSFLSLVVSYYGIFLYVCCYPYDLLYLWMYWARDFWFLDIRMSCSHPLCGQLFLHVISQWSSSIGSSNYEDTDHVANGLWLCCCEARLVTYRSLRMPKTKCQILFESGLIEIEIKRKKRISIWVILQVSYCFGVHSRAHFCHVMARNVMGVCLAQQYGWCGSVFE